MRRFTFISTILTFCMLFPLAGGMGETLSLKVTVDTADIRFYDTKGGKVAFSVEGYGYTNYFDYPGIPYRVVNVLLPQGEIVSSFDVRVLESLVVDESIDLAPFEGDLLEDGTRAGIVATSSEVTKDGSLFPRWKVLHLGSNNYRGYRMAIFALYPFQYDLGSGRLTLDRNLELVVETEPSSRYTDCLLYTSPSPRDRS